MSWIKLFKKGNVSIGTWEGDNNLVFTIEELTPEDVIGQDVEFDLTADELKQIIYKAKLEAW